MAKVLLSVRIPDNLMGEIDALSAKTKRDKTSVTVELLERGLSSIGDNPLTTANYVSLETFETAIAALKDEVETLKKSEPIE
jgi:predicted DNA-binding protein